MVVKRKMNSASLPPLRPDSEQLVDLHVYYLPPEVWNSTYKSVYNDVIDEAISIGFVRVWPELSLWNLRGELLNQLGPDSVPGEFVYIRSVGRCLTQVKGRQELELKVKAFLPPKNYAPEIFVLDGPQDVPDTALIEASKRKEEESSMEVDDEEGGDKDGREEKDVLGRLPHHLRQRLQAPTVNSTSKGASEHSVNAPNTQTNNSSPSSSEPNRTVTTGLVGGVSSDETPRKRGLGGRQEASANSDSGLEDQTPDEISERLHRDSQGSRGTFGDVVNDRQTTYQEDGPQQGRRRHRDEVQEDPEQRQYPTQAHEHFQESPRAYQDNQYQGNQYYPSSTQRSYQYDEPPASDLQRAVDQEGGYNQRGPASRQVPMLPVENLHQDRTPRGTYRQGLESDTSPRENESGFGHLDQGGQSQRFQDRRYDPSESGPSSGFNEESHDWQEDRGPHGRLPSNDQALDTQQAMAYLQLSTNRQLSPKTYSRPSNSDSPSEEPSSTLSTANPEKRMMLDQIGEEQQARLEMEKVREELIKKAKSLQGKTIDRRKKAFTEHELEARDYWKKRYYDEKKKTPGLEDQVSKLSGQVQQQNRKLMSHLEGKGAKQPKGPPSKKMDHKIQIFRHQHNIDDLKRQVDNARMKLATEIKLRTQAETELRILKTEVTQKKINVTLKRGRQLPPVPQTEVKPTPRGMRGTGRSGNSV